SPHARVGNCQASNKAEGHPKGWPFCAGAKKKVPDAALPYPACKRTIPAEGYGSAGPVNSAPPGNTERTTPPQNTPLQLILICYLANKKRDRYRKIINNNYITFRSLKIYLRDELRPVRQIKNLQQEHNYNDRNQRSRRAVAHRS
ncbi:hypothetical protein, partial [Pseudocitrobacter faecalis]|uniref:hypothetical protein n=1 Tax=Pseudocitrobacter faecalis TaxID=1398493 RepID=UPI003BA2EB51